MSNLIIEPDENEAVNFFNFAPRLDWQKELVKDVKIDWDYTQGTHTGLCSGTIGSGKSLVAAHLATDHVLTYPGSRILIGRKALPDLKDTIYTEILEHLICPYLVEGKDYWTNETRAKITFKNGSEIIGRSWSDRRYKKLGSLKLSAAIVEEAAENDPKDEQALDFIKMRIGRLPHIPVRWLLLLTNPDSPSHFLYKRYMVKKPPLSKVYYSFLKNNPYLDDKYEEGLKNDMDPKLARRMLNGEWIDIRGETIYEMYEPDQQFKDYRYKVDPRHPIHLCWDFNIGEGKPMSMCLFQYIDDVFHIFNEVIMHGMRTGDTCKELAHKGLLDYDCTYIIQGDASGRHNDTRSNNTDYDIINDFLSNYLVKDGSSHRYLNVDDQVPLSNPPVRDRHNMVNSYLCNALGMRRLYVYKDAETVDEGLRLTKLKENGNYIEDDGPNCPYQHVTTALGYGICSVLDNKNTDGTQLLQR